MNELFVVLADPTRLQILDALREQPRHVGELVDHVGMHQPGVSRHLRVLREAGLVRVQKDAQRRVYSLDPEPLIQMDAWLAGYRRLWDARLDRLADHLANKKRR